MHLLPTPRTSPSRPLRSAFAVLAIAAASQLAGCSIWPQALTFTAQPKPPPTAPAEAPASPAPETAAKPASVESQPVVQPVPPTVSSIPPSEPVMTPAEPAAMAATKPVPIGKASHSTPKPKTATAHKVPATGLVPGFYLNAGLFAVSSNGQNAYKKLEEAGLPVFAESIHSKKGPLTRLRVGPYLTRAEAVAAADSIRAMKLDAAVFKHPK